jgi:hypothetical protein
MLSKLITFLNNCPPKTIPGDKKLHYICGVITYSIPAYFFGATIGMISLIVAATSKEVYDCYKTHPTGFDLGDLGMTMAGGTTCFLIHMLFLTHK